MLSRRELDIISKAGIDRKDYKQLHTVYAEPKTKQHYNKCGLFTVKTAYGPRKPDIVIALGKSLVAGKMINEICKELNINRKFVYRWGKRLKIGKYS